MVSNNLKSRSAAEWLSSLPACIMLLLVVIFSTSSDVHNQILKLGEHYWPGYYKLRVDPAVPTCDPNVNVEEQLQSRLAQNDADSEFGAGLFDSSNIDPELIRKSIESSKEECANKFRTFDEVNAQITPTVKSFRSVEQAVSAAIGIGIMSQKFILVILILLCAMTATLKNHHIAMRPVASKLDHYFSGIAQIIGNVLLLISSIAFRELATSGSSTIAAADALLHELWVYGFAALTLVSIVNLFRMSKDLTPGGNINRAGLAMPMYAVMTMITAAFFFSRGHFAGIGIYIEKLVDLADMFLNVGLYIWVGMMLKQTRFASLVLALFKPWKLPPELLAVFVVVLAAIPTAYTGGSGVFVISAGAVIYAELRAAGARRNLALAATAMSGSMGVVLRPCLLVVVVAFMNREVTTDQLFGWGIYVFLLSAAMFFLFAMTLNRENKLALAPVSQAFPEMLRAIKPLIPYFLCLAAVVLFYRIAVNVRLDEFSAARILPVMLLAILFYEHFAKKESMDDDGVKLVPHKGIETCIRTATNQTTGEIGALLLLVVCSICLGGMVERSGIIEQFPSSFSNPYTAMTLIVCVLIFLGMIMEAFGAVILVSQTIAVIAYKSGIDPIHFWMVTLCAFELGYLTPPVALNQLLARQVVGVKEVMEADSIEGTFYQRWERVLLPCITMATVLLIVAYGPLIYGYNH